MSQSSNGMVVLEVPARLSWSDWEARVRNLGMVRKKLPWYVGDLLIYGEQAFGEKASQLLNEFGYTERQLSQYRYVAKRFPVEDRCDLPWSWHQAAAALPKRERDKALTAALAGEMNRADLRALALTNGTAGAKNGSDGSGGLPSAKNAAFKALGLAMRDVASLFRRKAENEEWLTVLDELMEKAIAARESLSRGRDMEGSK